MYRIKPPKRILTIITSIICFCTAFSQQDSCDVQISLLTCTPGTELYSTFGHSALRVKDNSNDIIYNYGTFDFDDPDFYSKFVKGKLLYFVSTDKFENFVEEYQYEHRGITEQILHLTCEQKQQFILALQTNAKEENKYYKYDFILDNCTTRLRDLVLSQANGKSETKDIRPNEDVTFRHLIHEYLDKNNQPWNKLGIDILLGAKLDRKISNKEAMFLPDYLMKAFDSTTINGKPLVEQKEIALKGRLEPGKASFFSPFVILGIVFLIIAALTIAGKAKKFFIIFDFTLFFICGLLGILLLFMWFGTDHQTCRNNYNLIWAFPGHFIVVFFFFKKWKWLKNYFRIVGVAMQLLLILGWTFIPQEMNDALLPIVGMLFTRSIVRAKKYG